MSSLRTSQSSNSNSRSSGNGSSGSNSSSNDYLAEMLNNLDKITEDQATWTQTVERTWETIVENEQGELKSMKLKQLKERKNK
jgi:hypothetical protein